MDVKDKDAAAVAPEKLPNFISTNLRFLRKSEGFSQSELAQRVGLNRGNIASYESGSAEPSICKLLRLGKVFRVTGHDFTRRDLSDPAELALARHAFDAERDRPAAMLAEYRRRHAELAELVESAHRLFEYKQERIEKPCREAEVLGAHYRQLYDLTQQLLEEQRELLGC